MSFICTALPNLCVGLFVSSLMQVEVYNMGMALAGASGTVVVQRGQAVPGRFTITTPHEKVCVCVSCRNGGGSTIYVNIPVALVT